MRSNTGTKAATRSPTTSKGFSTIKPKGRASSPSASGPSGLKRLPGRDLVVVASNASPRIFDSSFVEVTPIAPEDLRIELLGSHDEDEIAWQRAYDAARVLATQRQAHGRQSVARRRRRWRHMLQYSVTGSLSVMIGIGASLLAYDMRMGNLNTPEWFTVLAPVKSDVPAIAVAEPAPALQPTPISSVDETQTSSIPQLSASPAPKRVKTIGVAHLAVEDVQGEALQYIPLDISAESSGPDEKIAIRLSGLPDDAMLTSGRKLGDGTWLVADGQEETVKLVLPSLTSGKLALGVEAVMLPTGEEATPMKEMTVFISPAKADMAVVPAGDEVAKASFDKTGPISLNLSKDPVPKRLAEASPQSLPDAVPPPDEALPQPAAGIAARGDAALKSGDVAEARSFYLRAFEQGNTSAAAGVARTYDPIIFKKLKVRGLKPDAAKAREWYAKAAEVGDTEAAKRADALQAAN